MGKSEKLLVRLRNSLSGVHFEEAGKIAERLEFQRKGGQGSHRTYAREDEPLLLNFQDRGGFIKPYQARQRLNMVIKYESDPDVSTIANSRESVPRSVFHQILATKEILN